MTNSSALCVKVPFRDEGEFYARLGDHVAENGLRIPADRPRVVGERVRIALQFKDGGTLRGEAVVAEHIRVGDRPGMSVRFVRFDRRATGGATSPAARSDPAGPGASPEEAVAEAAPDDVVAVEGDEPLGPTPGEGDAPADGNAPAAPAATGIGSWSRFGRGLAAGVLAAGALAFAVGFALARRPVSPEAAAAAQVATADRRLAEGRVIGDDGALEHLLAAVAARPGDAAARARLAHVADMLEALGTRALGRGDFAVAVVHLEKAKLAAPDRASIREKLATASAGARVDRRSAGERAAPGKAHRKRSG